MGGNLVSRLQVPPLRVWLLWLLAVASLFPASVAIALARPAGLPAALSSIRVPAVADVPGSPETLPFSVASTFAGTDAVYAIHLDAGQRLVSWLYGPSSAPLCSLFLYAPGALSVEDTSSLLDGSPLFRGYPCVISHVATQTGTYYLDAFTWGAGGAYDLLAWVKPPDFDAEPSGATSESLPFAVSDSLTATSDTDDVFKVHLARGQILQATLNGAVGTGFSLSLFANSASGTPSPTVDDPTLAIVASQLPATSTQSFKWAASRTGDYFIDAGQVPSGLGYASADGTYTLEAAVVSRSATSLSIVCAPTRVSTGRWTAVRGRLSGGTAGDVCTLEVKLPGRNTFGSLAKVRCKARGTWSWSYRPRKRGTYGFRVTFAGDGYRAACVSSAALKVRN
jgi:hypothetical protein